MSPEQEQLWQALEAWFATLSPSEQQIMLTIFEKILERAHTMAPEAYKAWLGQVMPDVMQLPHLLRHLNS